VISLIVVLLVSFVVTKYKKKETFAGCDNDTADQHADISKNAAKACKQISSRAEEIKAAAGGAAKIIDSTFGLFSPKNYKAGDNTTSNMMRNIVNTNLSSCDVEKISSSCKNSVANSQTNILDATECEYCQKNGCDMKDNIQKNKGDIEQTCELRLGIKALSEKTNSVDAQALAKVLQESEGLLSGNNEFKSENCNVINKDLSTSRYLENRNECLNNFTSMQENIGKACGPFISNIQENELENIQKCMGNTIIEKKDSKTDTTKAKTKVDSDQKTKGIDMNALMSSASSFISSSIFSLIILGVLYYISEQEILPSGK